MNKRQRKKNNRRFLEKVLKRADIGMLYGIKRHRAFSKEYEKTAKREGWPTPFNPIPIEEQGGGVPWED